MAYKTVMCPIEVPSGSRCWDYEGDRSICDYLDFGNKAMCQVFQQRPRQAKCGIKKLAKCLKLKDK